MRAWTAPVHSVLPRVSRTQPGDIYDHPKGVQESTDKAVGVITDQGGQISGNKGYRNRGAESHGKRTRYSAPHRGGRLTMESTDKVNI